MEKPDHLLWLLLNCCFVLLLCLLTYQLHVERTLSRNWEQAYHSAQDAAGAYSSMWHETESSRNLCVQQFLQLKVQCNTNQEGGTR